MQSSDRNSVSDKIDRPASTDASNALSNYVFNDPSEFLKVLIANNDKIGTWHDYGTTTSIKDYEYASTHAEDPKVRAAAGIAAKHFDEMVLMDKTDQYSRSTLNVTALQHILKYQQGESLGTQLAWQETKNVAGTIGCAALTVASGALTAVSALELPWLAVGAGIGTASGALLTYDSGKNSYLYPSALRARAADTQAKLNSWPEINSQLRKPA